MHSFIVHLVGEEGAPLEAQLVQSHKGMSLDDVFDEVYELSLEGRLRTDMLIVRLPVDEQWDDVEIKGKSSDRAKELFGLKGLSEPFGRLRDRSVHLLTSLRGQQILTENVNPHWPYDPLLVYGVSPEIALREIQKAEFNFILERSRAVLTSPPGSEFRAPSGRLVKSFVRVGNVQYDRDAIDAIFFWILPYLDGVGAILTDTWSISSIAFNLANLSNSYFGVGHVPVEMLPSYHDGSEAATIRTRAVVERLANDLEAVGSDRRTVLCLISATQTGSLASHVQHIFDSSGLTCTPRYVALFALGPTSIASLHDLHEDARFSLLSETEEKTNQAVQIDPQVYFPLQFQDIQYEIDKAVADTSRVFFDRYLGCGLIQVHRTHDDGTGRPRHHGIHLETAVLVDVPEFVLRYEEALGRLPSPPTVIVCPPHEAGRSLASHAANYFRRQFGRSPREYGHPNLFLDTARLSSEEAELRDFLARSSQSTSLLIVDDVCITGTRLSQYQRYIRTEGYKGRIDYLVGISRVPYPEIWANLQRYLGYRGGGQERHTVQCVETVILPDWREQDCPWCCERRLYEAWQNSASLSDSLVERLAHLSGSVVSGLAEELYLEFPGLPSMSLGPNSLFTRNSANQAEVFAAVSSALQQLRSARSTEKPALGPRRFPISTVLNHRDYLRSKWTDSILRATFLRAASVDELTYAAPEKEKERSEALRDLAIQSANGEHEVALEILLAALLGKCSIQVDQDMAKALATFGSHEICASLVQRLQV